MQDRTEVGLGLKRHANISCALKNFLQSSNYFDFTQLVCLSCTRELRKVVSYNMIHIVSHPNNQSSAGIAVLFLCICLFLQVLGVPASLLNPSVSNDPVGASVLEGFSVPSMLVQLNIWPEKAYRRDSLLSLHVLERASDIFHPPVF